MKRRQGRNADGRKERKGGQISMDGRKEGEEGRREREKEKQKGKGGY
jgi:hypothetical protein